MTDEELRGALASLGFRETAVGSSTYALEMGERCGVVAAYSHNNVWRVSRVYSDEETIERQTRMPARTARQVDMLASAGCVLQAIDNLMNSERY